MRKTAILPLLISVLPAFLFSCGAGSHFHPPADTDWSVLPADQRGGIALYGDCRTNHDVHRAVARGIESVAPSAVFVSGDLVEDGDNPLLWQTFNAITATLRAMAPYYTALGNHEDESPLYFDNFVLPGNERWYAVDVADIHFVVLDSCYPLDAGSQQDQWLSADLAARPAGTRATVAVFHHPPISSGDAVMDPRDLRSHLVPRLEAAGVDLVVCGHDHDYERLAVNGVTYMVSGGAGAPLDTRYRTLPETVVFDSVHHFGVLHSSAGSLSAAGSLEVDVWDLAASLVDRFTVGGP